MLDFFIVRKTFYGLVATVTVDVRKAEADFRATLDGRIVLDESLKHFHEVATPEKAEAWLSRDMGETGTFVETLWQRYRARA